MGNSAVEWYRFKLAKSISFKHTETYLYNSNNGVSWNGIFPQNCCVVCIDSIKLRPVAVLFINNIATAAQTPVNSHTDIPLNMA